jgi:serine/threonine protein kinase
VSVVEHIGSGRIVVWKQIFIPEGEEEKILREAKLAEEMESEYGVDILDSFVEEGYVYIVMEFYSGGTLLRLSEELKKSKKMIEERVFIFNAF